LLSDTQILESALYVVRFQRGDRRAFEEIVSLWERPLLYYLRRFLRNEADAWETLQDTWMKLFRSLGSLRDPRTLPAFLYATARNAAISRVRKRGGQEFESYTDETYDGSAAEDVSAFDNVELVHHALDQLPLAQREALTLFFLQDLSLKEIATLLEVPVGTVKSRIHHGKIAVRKLLEQRD
jgi:RNA polymerase sigma-70 factor (ECF subfamily)